MDKKLYKIELLATNEAVYQHYEVLASNFESAFKEANSLIDEVEDSKLHIGSIQQMYAEILEAD